MRRGTQNPRRGNFRSKSVGGSGLLTQHVTAWMWGGRAGDGDQFDISQGGSDLFCLGEHPQAPTWEVKIQADLNPAGVFAFCQWK